MWNSLSIPVLARQFLLPLVLLTTVSPERILFREHGPENIKDIPALAEPPIPGVVSEAANRAYKRLATGKTCRCGRGCGGGRVRGQ